MIFVQVHYYRSDTLSIMLFTNTTHLIKPLLFCWWIYLPVYIAARSQLWITP